jgi:uncharacterized protein (TIGR02757 family)
MRLEQKLDFHYKAFNRSKIEPDPLQFLYMFKKESDIEVMGFIASVFAYGNVKQIINTLNKFLKLCNNKPYIFVSSFHYENKLELAHRFYTNEDVKTLFLILSKVYKEYGSLKNLFYLCFNLNKTDMKKSISCFSNHFINEILNLKKELTTGLKFMFPLPGKGSACKRMNLFLRWMVRKDEIDFGLWNKIPASKLIIPVDTHVARISKQLGLTSRTNPDWKMAEEITENLRRFDPVDPVKYDFALCHIGMRKLDF